MTYNAGATKSGPYDADGVQTVFSYGFKCYAKTDLEAVYTDSLGVESIFDPSNYSMDGLSLDAGGSVTFLTAPTDGGLVTFRLNPPKEQGVNLRNQGPYTPENVERMADRLAMIILAQAEELSRAVKVDISSGISSTEYLAEAQAAAAASEASASNSADSEAAAEIAAAEAAVSAAAAAAAGAGLKYRSVRVATTANGTISTAYANGQTVDGVVLVTGDRILLKNQTTASQNGIYTVNPSGSPTRATDADLWVEIVSSVAIVSAGSTNAGSVWLCTVNDGGTLGSTDITYIDYGSTIVNGTLALTKLAALAANTIVANATGSSASPTAVALAANQFLARSSAGNMAAKAITDFALSVLDDSSASAARATLEAAAIAQVDFISGEIDTASNRDYVIALIVPYGFSITKFSTKASSGTCTAVLKNTTGTVATNSVSTSQVDNTTITNAAVATGEKVYITISSNAAAKCVAFAVHFTRNLA